MTDSGAVPSLNMDRFLILSIQVLDNYFFRGSTEKARKLYREIERGDVVRVASLGFDQDADLKVTLKLALRHPEQRGHLTFDLFRAALDVLLKNLGARIRDREDLNMFTGEETGEVIFNVPGLVEDRGNLFLLVLGLVPGKGNVIMRLRFLDSDQYSAPTVTNGDTGNL